MYRVEFRNGGELVKAIDVATLDEARAAADDAAMEEYGANFAAVKDLDAGGAEVTSRRDNAAFTNGGQPGVRMKSYKLKDAGKGAFQIGPLSKWVGFGAVDAGRVITVRVEDIALERLHRSIDGGTDYLSVLEVNRGRIFRIAQRKYERGSIEPDGSVSVTDADVAEEV